MQLARRALLCALVAAGTSGPAGQADVGARASPWRGLAPGIDLASAADVGGDPGWGARVVRIDPLRARLSVQFDAAGPTLGEWRNRFPQALVLANGSFYSTDAPLGAVRPTCDLVVAGKVVRGAGCRRKDALFFGAVPTVDREMRAPMSLLQSGAQTSAGCGSPATTRFFVPDDFHADEWVDALKSFPALVHGCAAACPGPRYCAERSRTAALAQLRDGRIVLFASQGPAIRREVARFLAEALDAAEAVNLDGGPEATLSVRGEAPGQAIATLGTRLPLVILVLPPTPVSRGKTAPSVE